MQEIFKKLDLEDYIISFEKLFARQKDMILEGDINLHFKLISDLDKYTFKEPPKLINLDNVLMHLQKQGILKLDDIFEIIKIIRYFIYLKKFPFEGKLQEWFDKIIIPSELENFNSFFSSKGELESGIDQDLDLIKNAIYSNKESIKQALYRVVNSSKLRSYLVDMQVHLVNSEETLLVRSGFNHVLKAKVINRSNSGFFYVLPHSVNDLKQKQSDLINKQEEIVLKLCKSISGVFEKSLMFLKYINKEFDRFDHYQARLFFAKIDDRNFIIPNKNANNKLIDFEHPALHKAKAITVDFSKAVIMITGVNAGGKTMMLKSVLSAVLLSKYLIPYKADKNSSIAYFKNIVAVLDDPQSVKNDISTFAGRMVEFSKLFTKKNVIVGVDEIELGTDSDEAASLFKVIIEELIKKDIKVIITTHHKRLAALMAANSEVELIAALYDEKNRVPTYDFMQGTIGKSYAFETASRYGIPQNVIKLAKEVYGEDKDKLNELIERSSKLEQEYQTKIALLDEKIQEHDKLNHGLRDQKDSLDSLIYNEQSKLHREYKDATSEAKKAIKAKIIQESHQHLNFAHKKVKDISVSKVQEEIVFKRNDRIKYQSSKGEILSIKGKKAFIQTDGGMRLQVLLSDLKRSGNEIKPKIKKRVTISVAKPSSGHVNLDLHGQRSDEAIDNLDKFISDSLIAGFDEILVYHGIGTGKLAYAVKKFLDEHRSVVSYSDAHAAQGGFGAKIIKL